MTIYEIRHTNLLTLIADYGSLANLNEALGRKRNDAALALIKNKSIGFRGKIRNMGPTLARLIEEKLNLDEGWMDKDHSKAKLSQSMEAFAEKAGFKAIPLLTLEEAAQLTPNTPMNSDQYEDFTYFRKSAPDNCFAVIISGQGMAPYYLDGDIVIIEPREPKPSELVLAKGKDYEGNPCTFGKYRPGRFNSEGKEYFELASFNEDYPVMRSDQRDYEILGVMIGLHRG